MTARHKSMVVASTTYNMFLNRKPCLGSALLTAAQQASEQRLVRRVYGFIGIDARQRGATDRRPYTQVIELAPLGAQVAHDVTQALSARQLRQAKGHELRPSGSKNHSTRHGSVQSRLHLKVCGTAVAENGPENLNHNRLDNAIYWGDRVRTVTDIKLPTASQAQPVFCGFLRLARGKVIFRHRPYCSRPWRVGRFLDRQTDARRLIRPPGA